MAKKIHEFEVLSNGSDKVTYTIWWDGRKIDSNNPLLLKSLKGITILDKRFSDGLAFFNLLPMHFKNGYLSLKRKE
jgi:hypothetical protein